MKYVLAAVIMVIIVGAPLACIYLRVKRGNKSKAPLVINVLSFFAFLGVAAVYLFGMSASAADTATTALASSDGFVKGMGYLSSALAVGLSGIGGGIAVSASASAALGAISENESIFGKSLIFVGMAEGVALYGLVVSFMIFLSL